MARYRDALPQLGGDLFLTDGGIETSMIALEGLDLPEFAVFPLLAEPDGERALRRYFSTYVDIARRHGVGLILEAATWRASADWGARLGLTRAAVAEANRTAIRLLEEVRGTEEAEEMPVVLSGCVGPRRDGYEPAEAMSADEAEAYHLAQITTFADTEADMVAALTLNYPDEAIGIARAAKVVSMPVAISFTVETDGRLASGTTLRAAVEAVDAATAAYPSYYMVNCAHPSHFGQALVAGEPWVARVRGLRANASRLSHAEIDALPAPDPGDPEELGCEYATLKRRLPHLNVLGGCCGTDHRHLEHIAVALTPLFGGDA
jgi:S-methylmethionine-dependent homocysteine/selenocysteine methylase